LKKPKPSKAPSETLRDDGEDMPLDVKLGDVLIREIIAEKYPPGSWIREQDLAERFQISRSPVREALRHVARRGFVRMVPWRGAQVVELSAQETRYIFDLLEAVFGVVAKIAAETYPDDKMDELKEIIRHGESLFERPSTRQERTNFTFVLGRTLARWGASRTSYELMVHAGSLALWQHRFMPPDDMETARRQMEIHRVLASAVMARDPRTAEWAARSMVAVTRGDLLARMPS
jgi:GntR family transcriptional regulator, rspAB operon transcriptional repressor